VDEVGEVEDLVDRRTDHRQPERRLQRLGLAQLVDLARELANELQNLRRRKIIELEEIVEVRADELDVIARRLEEVRRGELDRADAVRQTAERRAEVDRQACGRGTVERRGNEGSEIGQAVEEFTDVDASVGRMRARIVQRERERRIGARLTVDDGDAGEAEMGKRIDIIGAQLERARPGRVLDEEPVVRAVAGQDLAQVTLACVLKSMPATPCPRSKPRSRSADAETSRAKSSV
jgi:hypothetical protein